MARMAFVLSTFALHDYTSEIYEDCVISFPFLVASITKPLRTAFSS